MRRSSWIALAIAAGCGSDDLTAIALTAENQYTHASNPVAADALRELAARRGWDLTITTDPATFTPARLASTDVVVFSLTSGNILDDAARAALESYFTSGGGFVGTHSASTTEQGWPFYKTLVPATFWSHPADILDATLTVENAAHPIVAGLPTAWMRADEWYSFYERPEELGLDILLALDEASLGDEYPRELAVGYHPLAWAHAKHGGRAFYTALGHTPESYAEPAFMQMLEQGIEWAAHR